MMDVDFQENDNWDPVQQSREGQRGGMVGFLIKKGIVKNKKQANYVLFGLSGIFFLLMIYFIVSAL